MDATIKTFISVLAEALQPSILDTATIGQVEHVNQESIVIVVEQQEIMVATIILVEIALINHLVITVEHQEVMVATVIVQADVDIVQFVVLVVVIPVATIYM